MKRPPHAHLSLWFGAAAIAAAGFAASIAGPRPARADAAMPALRIGLPLGELVGRDARVTVLATPAGTRYDIRTLDGALVAGNLTAAEVGALLPGQDPRGVFAVDEPAGIPLMLADPDALRRGLE